MYTCIVPLDCQRIHLYQLTHFPSYKRHLSSPLLFFFNLFVYSLSGKFFKAFPSLKQNILENIFKTACFDDTLWLILYRILPVQAFSSRQEFFLSTFLRFFLFVTASLNFFSWPSLAKSENIMQTLSKPRNIEHNKENKSP